MSDRAPASKALRRRCDDDDHVDDNNCIWVFYMRVRYTLGIYQRLYNVFFSSNIHKAIMCTKVRI